MPSLSTETSLERMLFSVTASGYAVIVLVSYLELILGWQVVMAWVYAHETLTTGVLALASAATGSWFLYRQTSLHERQETQRLSRQREAVRTVLPLALSMVIRYAVTSAKATKLMLDQCVGESLPDRNQLTIPDLPALPNEAISTIRELAESVSLIEVRPLAILVADIQVQASRLATTLAKAGNGEHITAKSNLEEYIVDCALIHARAGSLFEFARREHDTIRNRVKWRDVYDAIKFFDLFGSKYDPVRERVDRYAGGDKDALVDERFSALG